MIGPPSHDGALDRARVIASPVRARIHELVAAATEALTVADLVRLTSLHRSAVRLHLRQLADAGLVREFTLPPSGRGRPKLAYRAVDAQPYRTVASWMAAALSSAAAVELGRRVGDSLANAGVDAVQQVVDEALRRGFDPEVIDHGPSVDVVLRACPFAEIARESPAAICGLHRGVMEGIVAATGGVRVDGLDIEDPSRGGCRLRLARIHM